MTCNGCSGFDEGSVFGLRFSYKHSCCSNDESPKKDAVISLSELFSK